MHLDSTLTVLCSIAGTFGQTVMMVFFYGKLTQRVSGNFERLVKVEMQAEELNDKLLPILGEHRIFHHHQRFNGSTT